MWPHLASLKLWGPLFLSFSGNAENWLRSEAAAPVWGTFSHITTFRNGTHQGRYHTNMYPWIPSEPYRFLHVSLFEIIPLCIPSLAILTSLDFFIPSWYLLYVPLSQVPINRFNSSVCPLPLCPITFLLLDQKEPSWPPHTCPLHICEMGFK